MQNLSRNVIWYIYLEALEIFAEFINFVIHKPHFQLKFDSQITDTTCSL